MIVASSPSQIRHTHSLKRGRFHFKAPLTANKIPDCQDLDQNYTVVSPTHYNYRVFYLNLRLL